MPGHQHVRRRHQEQAAEDVNDPVEPVDEHRAAGDHDAAQHHRPQHAPEQHPVLVGQGHSEVGEDQGDDEDVVQAQGFFHHVPGEKIQGRLLAAQLLDQPAAEMDPVVFVDEVHPDVERQGQHHPEHRPGHRLAQGNFPRLAVEHPQVQDEHQENKQQESDPGQVRQESPRRRLSNRLLYRSARTDSTVCYGRPRKTFCRFGKGVEKPGPVGEPFFPVDPKPLPQSLWPPLPSL